MKGPLFKAAMSLLVFIGLLNLAATVLYLYWIVWWFDMLVHFLSGACVALGFGWAWYGLRNRVPSRRAFFFNTLAAVIFVGLLWEVYELAYGITSLADGMRYVTDTVSDVTMDTLGGLLGIAYGVRHLQEQVS